MPDATPTPDVPESDLPDDLSALLVRLARGWSPAPFRPSPLAELAVDGTVVLGEGVDAVSTGFSMSRGSLRVETIGPAPTSMTTLFLGGAQFGPVTGTFETGEPLTGRGTKNMTRYLSGALRVESAVLVEDWTVWGETSRYGVSRIGAPGPDVAIGNLVLWTAGPSGTWEGRVGHLALRAGYAYYLVAHRPAQRPSNATWWIVVDPGGDALDSDRVISDLVAIRFALATSFDTHTFAAMDGQGRTVGGFGLDARRIGGRISNGLAPPVPTREPLTWAVPFVKALAAAVPAEGASPVSVALDRYDQSVRALDIDNQYLHVVGAIATLAQSVAAALNVEATLAEDDAAWGAWVDQESESIQSLAREGASEALVAAVHRAAEAGVGRLVANVYEASEIEGGDAVGAEVERSREVYLRGSLVPLADQGEASVRQGYDRVQALRKAFVALVAARVGYSGRISPFGTLGDPESSVPRVGDRPIGTNEAQEAQYKMTAVAEVAQGLVVDWPTYEAPRLPGDARVEALDVYAGRLEARTGGEVTAALRPLPRPPRSGRSDADAEEALGSLMSFRLYLSRYPETQTALFSAELTDAGLLIQGWGEADVLLPDVGAVQAFLLRVADSPEVRYRVEQLLALADERARVRAHDGGHEPPQAERSTPRLPIGDAPEDPAEPAL